MNTPPMASRALDGTYSRFFREGDRVVMEKPNETSICRLSHSIDNVGEVGLRLELIRFDSSDNTWLASWDEETHHGWFFQDCLTLEPPVSEEEVEEALNSIKQGLHPDLLRVLQREAEAVAQGYVEGDVNHYIQPIIGHLRLMLEQGEIPDQKFMKHMVERLAKACNAEIAWLATKSES